MTLLDEVRKRDTYIGQFEVIAASSAFLSFTPEFFKGRPVQLWIDNSGAIGCLIKGYSGTCKADSRLRKAGQCIPLRRRHKGLSIPLHRLCPDRFERSRRAFTVARDERGRAGRMDTLPWPVRRTDITERRRYSRSVSHVYLHRKVPTLGQLYTTVRSDTSLTERCQRRSDAVGIAGRPH